MKNRSFKQTGYFFPLFGSVKDTFLKYIIYIKPQDLESELYSLNQVSNLDCTPINCQVTSNRTGLSVDHNS